MQIAPSCSLLHVPIDLALETALDAEIKSWLAFSVQKLGELATLGTALGDGRDSRRGRVWRHRTRQLHARKASPRIHDAKVAARVAGDRWRDAPPRQRVRRTRRRPACTLQPAAFPTTTIGSFPQTAEVRKARAAHAKGALSDAVYRRLSAGADGAGGVSWQEDIGLDVLVHGEFERNDMVQYFGEQLAGFAFTKHGWVQSYGSRYVRPPVLFGDVSRPQPMTVDWWRYAQSLTDEADEGDADRPRHHPELVVRPRRPAAQRRLPPDRARDPRRGRRPRSRRRRR